jgi:drug/metabolite transporter (DMT)-like permease
VALLWPVISGVFTGAPTFALDIPVITRIETWGALFGIGVFSTSFSFLLVYWLLPKVGATNLSLNTFITPISAILLGVLVLHERFLPVHIAGIIVIFLGLVFIDGRLVKRWMPKPKPA